MLHDSEIVSCSDLDAFNEILVTFGLSFLLEVKEALSILALLFESCVLLSYTVLSGNTGMKIWWIKHLRTLHLLSEILDPVNVLVAQVAYPSVTVWNGLKKKKTTVVKTLRH